MPFLKRPNPQITKLLEAFGTFRQMLFVHALAGSFPSFFSLSLPLFRRPLLALSSQHLLIATARHVSCIMMCYSHGPISFSPMFDDLSTRFESCQKFEGKEKKTDSATQSAGSPQQGIRETDHARPESIEELEEWSHGIARASDCV